MGEGKTRVILPLLIIYYSFIAENKSSILRLVFLAQLIHEAYDHLHKVLTTSVLNIKLLTMPFNRDVEVSTELIDIIKIQHHMCLESNGVFLLAPDHLLSLFLKTKELELTTNIDHNELSKSIRVMFNEFRFIDILDESDELLRQSYQLVYSFGNHVSLDAANSRYNIPAIILNTLANPSKELKEILSQPGVAIFENNNVNYSTEQFPKIRFLSTDTFKENKRKLLNLIASNIINFPPFELLWVQKYEKEKLVQFVTNFCVNGETIFGKDWLRMEKNEIDDLFVLRGYLAYDILVSCLVKRHRIDYGINRLPGLFS